MPAGDKVVADHQVEIRGTLTGATTPYPISFENVGGLGVPEAKTNDTTLAHAPGAYLGRDYTGVRVITIPYVLRGTAATVGANLLTLGTLWASSETDLPLHMRLPGMGHLTFTGRPRALLDDLSMLNRGAVRALATFVCGDPSTVGAPGAPTIGTATAGVGQATANWTAPVGSTVTGYQVKTYRASDGVVLFTDATGVALTFNRTGLTAGVAVYFKVAAVNTIGTGPQSTQSNTVTPT